MLPSDGWALSSIAESGTRTGQVRADAQSEAVRRDGPMAAAGALHERLPSLVGLFSVPIAVTTASSVAKAAAKGASRAHAAQVAETAHVCRAVQVDADNVVSGLLAGSRQTTSGSSSASSEASSSSRASSRDIVSVVPGIHTMSRSWRAMLRDETGLPAFLGLAAHERIRELAQRDQAARVIAFAVARTAWRTRVIQESVKLRREETWRASANSLSSAAPVPPTSARRTGSSSGSRFPSSPSSFELAGGRARDRPSANGSGQRSSRSLLAQAGSAALGRSVPGDRSETTQSTASASEFGLIGSGVSMGSHSTELRTAGEARQPSVAEARSASGCASARLRGFSARSSPATYEARDAPQSLCAGDAGYDEDELDQMATHAVLRVARQFSPVRLGDAFTLALGGDPTLPGARSEAHDQGRASCERFALAAGALPDDKVEASAEAATQAALSNGSASPEVPFAHGFCGWPAPWHPVHRAHTSHLTRRRRAASGQPRLRHDPSSVTLLELLRWWPIGVDAMDAKAMVDVIMTTAAPPPQPSAAVARLLGGEEVTRSVVNLAWRAVSAVGLKEANAAASARAASTAAAAVGSPLPTSSAQTCAAPKPASAPVKASEGPAAICVSLARLCEPGSGGPSTSSGGSTVSDSFASASPWPGARLPPSPHDGFVAFIPRTYCTPLHWRRPDAAGMPRPVRDRRTGLPVRPAGEEATMTMSDMQILVEALVQRHPDLAHIAKDPPLRLRYSAFVLAFCLGALRGYSATTYRPRDVHASNLVDALIACASNRLEGMMPFAPGEFLNYSRQFDWMLRQVEHAASMAAPDDATGASSPAELHAATAMPDDPTVGPLVSVDMLRRAAKMGLLPGMLGTAKRGGVRVPLEAPLAIPGWALERIGNGAPRKLASGRRGFLAFEDFMWLALSEKDAMAGPSIEYWCSVIDTDDDGFIGDMDVAAAIRYQELSAHGVSSPRTASKGLGLGRSIDEADTAEMVTVPREAAYCQLVDAVRPDSFMCTPQGKGCIRFTARTVRTRACGPVVFGLLLAMPPPDKAA